MKRIAAIPRLAAAALLAGVLPLGAYAVDESDFALNSTEDLYQLCSTTSENENFIPSVYACRGFLEGAVQYHDAVSDRKNLKRLICYPSDATLADGRQAFITWAKANQGNTELMGEMPVIGLVRALADKYPCPK
jgi:hypothetical protein